MAAARSSSDQGGSRAGISTRTRARPAPRNAPGRPGGRLARGRSGFRGASAPSAPSRKTDDRGPRGTTEERPFRRINGSRPDRSRPPGIPDPTAPRNSNGGRRGTNRGPGTTAPAGKPSRRAFTGPDSAVPIRVTGRWARRPVVLTGNPGGPAGSGESPMSHGGIQRGAVAFACRRGQTRTGGPRKFHDGTANRPRRANTPPPGSAAESGFEAGGAAPAIFPKNPTIGGLRRSGALRKRRSPKGRGRSSGVEHYLAKVRVVSSNLIARSKLSACLVGMAGAARAGVWCLRIPGAASLVTAACLYGQPPGGCERPTSGRHRRMAARIRAALIDASNRNSLRSARR